VLDARRRILRRELFHVDVARIAHRSDPRQQIPCLDVRLVRVSFKCV
jgi:hypothetical protein